VREKNSENPYYPSYIDEGSYVIEDPEYGHRLCRVDFLDVCKELTHEEMVDLLKEFTLKIREKLEAKALMAAGD